MYNINFSRKAAKLYQKTDSTTVKRLNRAFDKLSEDPFSHYSTKRLSGELEGSFRMRVGDIRIVYSVDDTNKLVNIEVIRFRGDVYKA